MSCSGRHVNPVHLDFASGSAWICLACEKQLAGLPMPESELRAMIDFLKDASTDLAKQAKAKRAQIRAKEKDMKLELGIMAGAESKAFLADFTKQIDRLEKLTGGKGLAKSNGAGATKASLDSDDEDTDLEEALGHAPQDSEDEDFAPKKKSKKSAASSFEDDDEEETVETSDDEEEIAPKKSTKTKKVTAKDVNDACKAYAEEHSFAEAKALLKKKFKTSSISQIPEEKYEAVIAAMAV